MIESRYEPHYDWIMYIAGNINWTELNLKWNSNYCNYTNKIIKGTLHMNENKTSQ